MIDLSYSGIVDKIQGEEIKGADMLVEIAVKKEEKEEVALNIIKTEKLLKELRCDEAHLKAGSKYILKHLKN